MLEIKHLNKRYQEDILKDINIVLPSTGMVMLVGKSGCGKTTLLNIIGGLDTKYEGEVFLFQKDIKRIKNYRNYVGFIFQNFHLLSWINTKQNIHLPSFFKKTYSKKRVQDNVSKMKLSSMSRKKIKYLSGGQKQRVAIARAIVSPIKILLCDEPTGSLDQNNAKEVFEILKRESRKRLVIVVTHSKSLANSYGDRIIELKDGEAHVTATKEVNEIDEVEDRSTAQSILKLFPLACLLTKAKWQRNMKICTGIALALFCILLTFTLSTGLKQQIKAQLQDMLPATTITIRSKSNTDITYDEVVELKKDDLIEHVYMEVEGYEFMGISQEEQYEENTTLYISDATKSLDSIKKLYMGTYPKKYDEIVVSKSCAKHLAKGKDIAELVNTTMNSWYYDGHELYKVPLTIVGISDAITSFDTIYFEELANIKMLSSLNSDLKKNSKASIIMIDVNKDKDIKECIDTLKKEYSDFEFKEAGSAIVNRVDSIIHQVQIVLFCFSVLAIISSCFLIGEVLFLSVVERTKDIGIFKCLGASDKKIGILVLIEAWIIITLAYISAFQMIQMVITFINDFVKKELMLESASGAFINLDYGLLLLVYVVSVIVGIASCLLPAIYAAKIDTIKALKHS